VLLRALAQAGTVRPQQSMDDCFESRSLAGIGAKGTCTCTRVVGRYRNIRPVTHDLFVARAGCFRAKRALSARLSILSSLVLGGLVPNVTDIQLDGRLLRHRWPPARVGRCPFGHA